ncbi:universal stress protein [Actinoplanes auranticolor]|uniref:Universal stress protein n=1 Tax=Actinoplanes auranticolor TaxID=47988 RepID=A0A919SVF6_9ACTN|nr:universal stress protein [Actinoplanes auranticolor]GIM77763.1 universal stress protein [Actinoplanes auranticolor]
MNTEELVVVGTDGSQHAQAAVRWAAGEAQRRGATLEVVNAFQQVWGTERESPGGSLLEVGHSRAAEILSDAELTAHDVAGEVPVRTVASVGHPLDILLKAAADATVVVVGSRGLGGFASLLLGSVGQGVAMHAPCPTVVVRGRTTTDRGPVVVGVAQSPEAPAALGPAFAEAATRGCALLAVRTYQTPVPPWSPDLLPSVQPTEEQEAAERTQLRDLLAPWQEKYPEVPVGTLVSRDDAAGLLIEMSHTAQLVVVGNRGRGSVAGTPAGLRRPECPSGN